MKRTRTLRLATTTVAISALTIMTIGGPVSAQELPESPLDDILDPILDPIMDLIGGDDEENGENGTEEDGGATPGPTTTGSADIPETGIGGFAGYANASGTTVCVGLPAELAEPLAPLLDGLGIAGSCPEVNLSGIRIDLAQTQASLQRAAEGEEVDSFAQALITNLLLGSPELDSPGACQGGPLNVSIPDETTPLITLSLLGVDCEETDERAFADVEIAGLDIRLGALIELGLPEELRDGLGDGIDQLNEALLGPLGEGICDGTSPIFDGLLGGGSLCEDGESFLQLTNPLNLDVPLVDLSLITATSEVVHDGESVTATASASLTGLNVLGIVCVGGDGTEPYEFTSTATSDGETASREAHAPDLQQRECSQDQSILRTLMSSDDLLGYIAIVEQVVQEELAGGAFEPLFDGLNDLLEALDTAVLQQGEAYVNPIVDAGTSAGTTPFAVIASLPLTVLGDTPLGAIGVAVIGNETAVGVNAEPAVTPAGPDPTPVPAPAPDPDPKPLPRTGAGMAGILGLAALGAAAALRRRDQ